MIRRLLGVAAGIVTVLAFYFIAPTPGEGEYLRISAFDRQPEVASAFEEMRRVNDTLRAVTFALQRSRAWEAARSLAADAAASKFVALKNVPPDVARAFEEAARAEFAMVPQAKTALRVVLQTSDEQVGYRKYVVLPQTDAQPCVILIQFRASTRGLRPIAGDRLLGVCGFYARFGRPGAGMQEWLESTRGVAATIDTSPGMRPRRRTREKLVGANIGFAAAEAACLAGRDEGCVQAVLDPFDFRQSSLIVEPSERTRGVFASFPSSGLYGPGSTLANLRAHVGDQRFQEIWSSAQMVDEAYQTATGEHIAVFARQLLLLDLYPHTPGPLRGGLSLFLGLTIGVTAAVWAIKRTRRERSGT